MNRILFLSFMTVVFVGCSNHSSDQTPSATTTLTDNPQIQEGLELVASNDCLSCHKVADKMVGPAYKTIAEKYPNTEEHRKSLAQKIIKGSSGNWGTLQMTPHPGLSTEDAEKMVYYILSVQ